MSNVVRLGFAVTSLLLVSLGGNSALLAAPLPRIPRNVDAFCGIAQAICERLACNQSPVKTAIATTSVNGLIKESVALRAEIRQLVLADPTADLAKLGQFKSQYQEINDYITQLHVEIENVYAMSVQYGQNAEMLKAIISLYNRDPSGMKRLSKIEKSDLVAQYQSQLQGVYKTRAEVFEKSAKLEASLKNLDQTITDRLETDKRVIDLANQRSTQKEDILVNMAKIDFHLWMVNEFANFVESNPSDRDLRYSLMALNSNSATNPVAGFGASFSAMIKAMAPELTSDIVTTRFFKEAVFSSISLFASTGRFGEGFKIDSPDLVTNVSYQTINNTTAIVVTLSSRPTPVTFFFDQGVTCNVPGMNYLSMQFKFPEL